MNRYRAKPNMSTSAIPTFEIREDGEWVMAIDALAAIAALRAELATMKRMADLCDFAPEADQLAEENKALREENARWRRAAIALLPLGDRDDVRDEWSDAFDALRAALASARHAPAQEEGEALVRRISAELHRLPNNNKGHEIGMMEVGYDSNGQLNYGPLWLSIDETDAILLGIYRALLTREPAEVEARTSEASKGASNVDGL